MFLQRAVIRTTQRLGARSLNFQSTSRRFASDEANALKGNADNAFNHERRAVKEHAAVSANFWRKMSIYIVVPSLILASANAWVRWKAHWEHWEHLPPLEERPQYAYQNVRTKNFWFGDGDKTLFWNDKVNYHKREDL